MSAIEIFGIFQGFHVFVVLKHHIIRFPLLELLFGVSYLGGGSSLPPEERGMSDSEQKIVGQQKDSNTHLSNRLEICQNDT